MTIKLTDARERLERIVEAAYTLGYHEVGVDPISEFADAVRAETLLEVRGMVEGQRFVESDKMFTEYEEGREEGFMDILTALDALEHTERDQAYNTGLSDLIATRIIDQLHLAEK